MGDLTAPAFSSPLFFFLTPHLALDGSKGARDSGTSWDRSSPWLGQSGSYGGEGGTAYGCGMRGSSRKTECLPQGVGIPSGGARTGAGVFYSARVSSVAQRLETRPCWSNN